MKKLFCVLFMILMVCASVRSAADTLPADSLMCQDSVYVAEQIDPYEEVSHEESLQQDDYVGLLDPDDYPPIIILFVIMGVYLIVSLLSYFGIEPFWLQIIGFISGILLILSPMWLYWCYHGF